MDDECLQQGSRDYALQYTMYSTRQNLDLNSINHGDMLLHNMHHTLHGDRERRVGDFSTFFLRRQMGARCVCERHEPGVNVTWAKHFA